MTLGFLGSFGHCVGMCGPLTVAFSLSGQQEKPKWQQQLYFHTLLNLGRIVSYVLVGAAIGAIGSIAIASGQMAGIGSEVRRWLAILTGIMLILFGLAQISPQFLPRLPLLHPLTHGKWHDRLSTGMVKLSLQTRWWTPAGLGLVWGLMPCGFLYAAQIKAAETGQLWQGAATMLAFGIGTLPMMLGVGVSTSFLSRDRRSQLFRLGGWITVAIGAIALLRTGDTMTDYTGHAALFCLMLALIARPISRLWAAPLQYRRILGVGAFVLALAHTTHMMAHTLDWNLAAFAFLLPAHQISLALGFVAIVLMTPAAITSCDRAQKFLGTRWRQIHLLGIPATILSVVHAVLIGSHYLGSVSQTNLVYAVLLGVATGGVLLVRSRWFWSIFHIEKYYVAARKSE
jgi:uncharacterized protein